MADSNDPKAEASAEKAYAAASEAVGGKGDSEAAAEEAAVEPDDKPVEFPAKLKRARKVAAKDDALAVAADPLPEVSPKVPDVPPAPALALRRVRAAAAPKAAKTTAAAPKRAAAKAVPAAPVKAAPSKAPLAKPAARLRKSPVQKTKTAPKAAFKTVDASTVAAPSTTSIAQRKGTLMDTTTTINEATSTMQNKAKEAFTKGSAMAGEFGEFAKGNVEAFVESGKILASGLQEMGNKLISEGKTAFETATTDVKALTAVKSPTEFFQLQTDILRRNFDTMVSTTTKNGEAMLKLTSDAIKPISGRVTLAVEKFKTAA